MDLGWEVVFRGNPFEHKPIPVIPAQAGMTVSALMAPQQCLQNPKLAEVINNQLTGNNA